MKIVVPSPSLVLLIGPSGSGKSTFAKRHFAPTEVLSSDTFRGLVADDEVDQTATPDAFDALHYVARKRLARGRLTVIDATSVRPEDRKARVALAREAHLLAVAIVFDLPAKLCLERNRDRPGRDMPAHVVRQQSEQLRRSLRNLKREGFHSVTILSTPEDVDAAEIVRAPLWTDRRGETGPFDIIGDVHGCFDELVELLRALGYDVDDDPQTARATPPAGRKAIFLGDLVDRGPNAPAVLRLVMAMVADGAALCVPGNHDAKLVRALQGRDVKIGHGLAQTLAQLDAEPASFRAGVASFLDGLVSHYVFDGGALVVAHAGMKEELQGRSSAHVREFALFGETTGETDEFGLPVRYDWAREYRGRAIVVYGHTPVAEPEWVNRTINIDTGCAFGGKLTALRYPEKQLISVPARRVYYEPVKPFAAARPHDDVLDVGDVLGKRVIDTRLHRNVTIREENAAAALEVMSRFAIDPRWLIYLPPTMAPTETRADGEVLEHPREAFAYFRGQGVSRLMCQEKHMGSRAIFVLCRDEVAAARRFGVPSGSAGVVYTRTGRPFFTDDRMQSEVLDRLRAAATRAGLWERLDTDWICLDAEILPWSAKAQELLRAQYAPTGAAGNAALSAAVALLEQSAEREDGSAPLLERFRARQACVERYVDAYRRYCWPVASVADLKIAPFQVPASEGRTHFAADHQWHMDTIGALCAADEALLRPTAHRVVDLADAASEDAAVAWWEALTAAGGEGMVVKPLAGIANGPRGLVQPGVKCRGREYLRIIYGPEYTLPEHMDRLRGRGVAAKRSLALREFALGVEALSRFVEREPLYRVHECVFGVLALESEPVDPRL